MKKILQAFAITAISFASIASAATIEDLMVAVKRDSDIRAREVLQEGVNPNLRGENGKTPLIHAIQEKSAKVLPVLLAARNIDINATNANNETPLMMAIYTDQNDLARRLINRGAETDRYGWTPLHYAASRSNLDMIKLLLARGADINAGDGTIEKIAAAHEVSPAQVILRWHIENGTIIIPKSVHADRQKENLNLFGFALTADEHAAIDALDGPTRAGHDPLTFTYA